MLLFFGFYMKEMLGFSFFLKKVCFGIFFGLCGSILFNWISTGRYYNVV